LIQHTWQSAKKSVFLPLVNKISKFQNKTNEQQNFQLSLDTISTYFHLVAPKL